VRQIPDAVDTVICASDDGCKYHPKHVEQLPDINKLCNIVSCWIYIGILLAHPVVHISRIGVKGPVLQNAANTSNRSETLNLFVRTMLSGAV
jgi:hypothetical protein